MAFLDFAAIKGSITIEEAVAMLGLQMHPKGNQLRGNCPACRTTDGRQLVVTPDKGVFYCFSAKRGGDVIALTAHIRNQPVKDAAGFLADRIGSVPVVPSTSTSPTQAPAAPQAEDPLARVAARLEAEHPQVQALGLSPDRAKSLGIGFDSRGMMRGRVLFPLYENGALVGFMGLDDKGNAKFPPNLSNVVPLRKSG